MEKIAIIGFSCLFPDAKNAEEFWHNLIEQTDSTSELSIDEIGIEPTIFYDPEKGKADKVYSLQGGFVRNFKFDGSGYNLPASFLQNLDDTFKWSLYAAKQALQNSGYLENKSVLSKCGVLLGSLSFPTKSSNQLFEPIYQQVLKPAIRELLQQQEFDLASLPNSEDTSFYNAMISGLPAAIVSQALSLSPIHFCLDAACSSPLYAARLASHYLWTHKADLMLAGGISCADPIFIRMLFSGIQGYPEHNDISRPLDKSSRGLLTSEGVGMLVLKRYSDAVRDGDRIYASIVGNGLSNDGRGKHLLSPNPKGQTLAFEKAYSEAQLNPKAIDYIECHATGTLLGDSTEFNSVETFFGKYGATPLSGSVKSNIGHLLTGAASASLIKVLLSMNKGIIPTTINITDPIGSEDNVIAPSRIVTSPTNWHSKSASIKRAAVSAFGLGGTNAHTILEQNKNTQTVEPSFPLKPVKMAIVGMDALFGSCDDLDTFEGSIYQGKQHFIPLPAQRWHGVENETELLKKYNLPEAKAPIGAYLSEFEIDTISSKIPPNELKKLNKQQLLMLKVAERALQDAGIKEGDNVAVLIATEAEFSVHQLQQRWNLSWEIKEGLNTGAISLSSDKVNKLETIVKDGIHQAVDSSEFVSYLTNIMASRISSIWDFTAPVFTISAGENSTFKVLEVAQNLLTTGEADAVLVGAVDLAGGMENVLLRSKIANINTGVNTLSYDQKANGWTVGEGAGAVVLKRHEVAKQENKCIYAVIDAISFTQKNATKNDLQSRLGSTDPNAVDSACQQAFEMAEIKPSEISYLEVFASGIPQEDEAEINGLLRAYPSGANKLTCAIGSVKSNIGHTYVASGIASLIKTALCLYYRYIPATPKWTGVKDIKKWENSPFYVVPESRPWFLNPETNKRTAAINSIGIDGTYAHLIISEEPNQQDRSSRFLQQMPLHLFAIAGNNRDDLLQQVDNLQNVVNSGTSLKKAASITFAKYQKRSQESYTLAIVARNAKELAKESEAAIKGVNNAFERGEEWQTPLGSYFTAKPLGKKGEVAFIYPAAVNSYLGIGRNLFRLFPKVHDDIILQNLDNRVHHVEGLVYPRSLNKLSNRQLETLEQQLLDDSAAMFENEIVVARLLSNILRDDFQIKPKFAFGYSLGEVSMMSAVGVWNQFGQMSNALNSSSLFGDRLSGAKNAVREFWQLPPVQQSPDNNFWCNYVLIATPSQVRESIVGENRVYLTQINTPEEVVIAGEPVACERVIEKLGCNAFRAPFDHVIHCEAMASEHEEIAKVNTLPVQENQQEIILYSACEYAPIKLESKEIAEGIATGLCKELDFPRLVNRLYNDGAKIFIETGAGSVCSRWIDKNLSDKEHMTISLNRRGVDDHSSIVKALAKLVSHQVSLDLSPLYSTVEEISKQGKHSHKKVMLGGDSFTASILTAENKKLFQNQVEVNQEPLEKIDYVEKTQPTFPSVEIDLPDKITPKSQPAKPEVNPIKKVAIPTIENQTKIPNNTPAKINSSKSTFTEKLASTVSLSSNRQSQYQKVNVNNSMIHKTHSTFLQSRQEFSQQLSEIIQLQIACAEQLFNS
ncbi:PfaB family protein [Plectonema cf. radiosum LEGE 06105]|uniref:PfaB family protein n=1 Tax=Plectonema cf. radiosum LEGE 06105 TaxID=945769 RepID=A0A8J7K2K9_9CYAN|nr:PfaB family protein [Plectonema radiosum]MBE9215266.1 PfaB family protein [Plectonema cf. radiosum LEGE 06105]